MFKELLAKLEIVSSSPMAFVAYVILAVGWLYVSYKAKRFAALQKLITHLKYEDKVKTLESELSIDISNSISPSDWLKRQKARYVFLGFLSTITVLIMAFAIQTNIIDIKNYTKYKDEELVSDSRAFLNGYYQSLINKTFDAYKYFSPNVEKFFLLENVGPKEVNYNIQNIYYKEFLNPSLTSYDQSWAVLDKYEDSCILTFIASESWYSNSKKEAVNIKSRYILKLDKRFKIYYLRANEIIEDSRRRKK